MAKKDTPMLQVQAYEYLKELIKNDDLDPDKFYSLNQMAKEHGFSRTPFRDAVLRLEQERYIDIYPSKGFKLHAMTREDMVETYQMRGAIESYCLKELSRGLDTERGQQYYEKITGKVRLQREIMNTTGDPEDFGRKDYEFHRSIVQYVGNRVMLEIYRQFMYRIFWLNVSSFSRKGRMQEAVEEHERFLSLIREKDLAGLDDLLNHHLSVPRAINVDLVGTSENNPA
ncbi:MAG: GntR family transcriptional regulator [Eubacterium sp.]|nr:GntR family transcriptional regulator [Eubacterium sp.]